MSLIPNTGLAVLRSVSRRAMDGHVLATRPGAYAGERDEWGQPSEAEPRPITLLDADCSVVADRLRIERLASGDARLAGADAVLRVDRASGLLGSAETDWAAVGLTVTYGPADGRVVRPAALTGVAHRGVDVLLGVRWTAPEVAAP